MDTSCQTCNAPAVWDVVVTVDDTAQARPCGQRETARLLCGACYDTSARVLRDFHVPFVSRLTS